MNPRANIGFRLAVSLWLLFAGSFASAQSARVYFSPPENLSHNSPDSALSYSAHMAVDARGNINIIWAEMDCIQVFPFTCTWHLFYTRSEDGGANFSTPKDIANQSPGDPLFGPQIAISPNGAINAAWEGDSTGADIFFARSTDGGATFSLPINVSIDNGLAADPEIAIDDHGMIGLVWAAINPDETVSSFFSRSTDGVNFSAPDELCGTGEICNAPQIAFDHQGHIDLVWSGAACASCTQDAVFSRSIDAGANFSAPLNLSNSTDPMVTTPEITLDENGTVNVVWSKGISGSAQVYFARSSNGSTFSKPLVLSMGPGNSTFPELAIGLARDREGLHGGIHDEVFGATPAAKNLRNICSPRRQAINAAWFNDATGEIFFSRSINRGTTFSTPKAISTPAGGGATEPYIAVDSDGRINLVWEDNATSAILFTRSNDGGVTFSAPRTISSSSTFSFSPQIVLDREGNLNVSWFDATNPIEDVFFSRGTSLNLLRKDARALPASDFKRGNTRDAMMDRLEKARRALKGNDRGRAVNDLTDLLQRVNGCGSSPDSNDWIIACNAQLEIRNSLNIVIAGLSH
jgi:hypothetical protein